MTQSVFRVARIVWVWVGPWSILLLVWQVGLHWAALAEALMFVVAASVATGMVIEESRRGN